MPPSKPKKQTRKRASRQSDFGTELRRIREAAGVSINELERRSGVNRSTIYSAEAHRRVIRATNRAKLFKALEEPPEPTANSMSTTHLERGILAFERLALAFERIAAALERTTSK